MRGSQLLRRRARVAVAAALLGLSPVAGTVSSVADEHEPMSDPLTIEGELTDEGITCPALRGDDGELYTLAGDIGELQPGQRVRVTGEVAEMSMCMQGTTIALDDITLLAE